MRRRAASAGVIVLIAGGCANPFAPVRSDYGPAIPVERTRRIDALELDRFVAQDQQEDAESVADRPSPFEGLTEMELTLEKARAETLANNLDLQVALVSPAIANESVGEAEAAFESAFTLTGSWVQTDTPTASSLTDAQANSQFIEPGVRVPLLSGGTATIGLPIRRTETNNTFSTLNPSYESDLEFSLSQPLLRGAGRRATTHALRIAAIDATITETRTKAQIIGQLAAVERSYWLLYAAREELKLRQQELEVAQRVLGQAQRLLDAGAVGEIELVRAESGVADRLDAILRAEREVLRQQRELKRIMNMAGLGVQNKTVILPTSPPDPVRYDFDAGELADVAVESRMELLELELQLIADASRIEFDKNQALPLLNIEGGYTVNGLGDDLDGSFDELADNEFEGWSIGLRGELPLGNQAAESRQRRSVLTRLQRISSRVSREQTVRQEVFDAVDRLGADWQRILAARQAVILNTRTLEAEQRQFDLGGSRATDVLDAASRLVSARSDEIRALVDYQLAQLTLAEATGTVLGAARVRWEPTDPEGDEARVVREAPAP